LIRGTNVELTEELLPDIDNWGEKVYARDCLGRKGVGVVCQVPVGNSIIDFKVTDLKTGRSKLVEVTSSPKGKNGRTDGRRKRKQKKAMERSGMPHEVLYGEDLTRISDRLKRNGS